MTSAKKGTPASLQQLLGAGQAVGGRGVGGGVGCGPGGGLGRGLGWARFPQLSNRLPKDHPAARALDAWAPDGLPCWDGRDQIYPPSHFALIVMHISKSE